MSLEILPVTGIGDIAPGADLAGVIAGVAPWLRDGDVLIVTSKIVSKAEGRLVAVPESGPERELARDEALAAETARPVASRGHVRIVQTHHGFVMASAGIDASNVDKSHLVLLPLDPDASARSLRAQLRERFGRDVAVIISDTMGRPWRLGLTDVALGAAGLDPIRDHRGETDPYGNELHITQMAVADELAAAGELVKGKCDQVPVAVVRGHLAPGPVGDDGPGARVLVRDAASDLFSQGTAEAHAAGLAAAAALRDVEAFGHDMADRAALDRAIAMVGPGADTGLRVRPVSGPGPDLPPHTSYLVEVAAPGAAAGDDRLVELGITLHRLRAALAAVGLASARVPSAGGSVGVLRRYLAVGAAAGATESG